MKIKSLFYYVLILAVFYLSGHSFHIDWLIFYQQELFRDGSLKEASGSIMPFVLVFLLYYWFTTNKIKMAKKQ
ncbi:hypothetical protein HNQ85_002693 [Anoxybacillus calidus]|jgi:hypothetical protein|uniref:Uncharacterized protein n=1 Tax=[Anoxybacillus] calidus TaxID=575178 RepID=A0A7V9Z1I2_9BACL|nr:hypothetical protein [Anoxybacillus calidus]MBA2872384.1 hypothetical protein [Anoxybacillus calidus]